ncbi:MAG: DNA adenine methylase [Planctomycetota bacterium]|nr:DNA adenine methylase [Planctomycetota bacterium]MDP7250426.1 DNA adenine methylase [Planctomycetota bacterium]
MTSTRARPFMKWAGGKGQLLPELLARMPGRFGTYFEPFVGGGALFFGLSSLGMLKKTLLSDVNEPLIGTYQAVRDNVDGVIHHLKTHRNEEDYYYGVRARNPRKPETRAARLIYLNKTCFNGLYRTNLQGGFNVPFGKYKKPNICNEKNIQAASAALQDAQIECLEYSDAVSRARKGDFVYFDPPYQPLTKTSSFTTYSRNGFKEEDQVRLSETFRELAERGVYVMLSNSDTPLIRKLYKDFKPERVFASRNINSKGNKRGKISELVVRSYR